MTVMNERTTQSTAFMATISPCGVCITPAECVAVARCAVALKQPPTTVEVLFKENARLWAEIDRLRVELHAAEMFGAGGWFGPGPQAQTTIRGNPEMLARLRAWAEPRIGPINSRSLIGLQTILEDASDKCGIVPMYRKVSDA